METAIQNQVGEVVDAVRLDIDYHIIEHFSKHLYSSPNKAIEELIINGYDAGADWVRVYLPGAHTTKIIVWDDGASMDVDGIKKLWKLADSPKSSTSREITDKNGTLRKVIGKFGIGKIASYTVGDSISHYCKTSDGYFLVSVEYDSLMEKKTSEENPQTESLPELEEGLKTESSSESEESSRAEPQPEVDRRSVPIIKLSEEEAISAIKSYFVILPANVDDLIASESWTFAVIDKIKRTDITQARLRWVIGNALPIKPGFQVYIDDTEVLPKLLKNGLRLDWSFGNAEVKDYLNTMWKDAVSEGVVDGSVTYGQAIGLDKDSPTKAIDYVDFPKLGRVWGKIRLYKESLFNYRKADDGRSYGFFVFVRDRLVNIDDAQLFLQGDPSFLTFYNAQFILHIDALDEDLLADRERITEGSPKIAELQVLQNSVYKAINKEQRVYYDEEHRKSSIESIFPVTSPSLFMEPLAALWVKNGANEELGFDFKTPKIETQPLGKAEHVSGFSVSEGFKVNSLHPYYQKLQHELGTGKVSAKALKEFEVIAVSEQLFTGHLYDLGISNEQVAKIMLWRDDLYRKLAQRDNKNPHQLAQNLFEASFKAGEPFESALVEVLGEIGFNAERDGAKGQKDVFVKAYCGDSSYKLIFEAKAMSSDKPYDEDKKALKNDSAETGGASGHRHKAGADHAVIIARKFAGFDQSDEPAIIEECRSMGKVSVMTVEALNELMFAVKEYAYSLETIKPVFFEIESPVKKLARIRSLAKPLESIDWVRLLHQIWEAQGEDTAEGVAVPIRGIWLDYGYRKANVDSNTFKGTLEALRTFAYPLVQFSGDSDIYLIQSPDNIITRIRKKLNID